MCYFQNYMFMSVNVWCVCCVTLRCVPLRCMRVCARVRALCVSWFVIVLPTRTWSAGLSMLLTVLPGSGVSRLPLRSLPGPLAEAYSNGRYEEALDGVRTLSGLPQWYTSHTGVS